MRPTSKQILKTLELVATGLIIAIAVMTAQVVHSYNFQFRSPLLMQDAIILSSKIEPAKTITVVQADTNVSPLTPDEQYGCNLFKADCKTFLAILAAESHANHAAINVNTDNSVDFGCMQINSVHLKQIDTTNINLLNCQQNIGVAYTIYHQQGNSFGAWASYTSGAYKKYLIQ